MNRLDQEAVRPACGSVTLDGPYTFIISPQCRGHPGTSLERHSWEWKGCQIRVASVNKLFRNALKLLALSDTIRAALSQRRKLTLLELEELAFVLDMMLLDEVDGKTASKAPATSLTSQTITFSVIQNTRLDKLLADIIHVYENGSTARPLIAEMGLGSEVEKVQSLQKHWRTRFKSEYFALDQYRLDILFSNALRDVLFSAIASDGLGIWSPKEPLTYELSEAEVSLHYTPGT